MNKAFPDRLPPRRLRRLRVKGWRMPQGAVFVGGPSVFASPFAPQGDFMDWMALSIGAPDGIAGRRHAAVTLYREWLLGEMPQPPLAAAPALDEKSAARVLAAGVAWTLRPDTPVPSPPSLLVLRHALAGRNLVCWCPLDQPCHGDVLLEIANTAPLRRRGQY